MKHVGSPRGIDGRIGYGQGPAITGLLRTLTAAAALSMAGTLEAQQTPNKPHTPQSTANAVAAPDHVEQQLDQWMNEMDSDEFMVREAAWHEFIDHLKKEHDVDDMVAESLLVRMRTTPRGEKRAQSLEQRERLRMAEELFHAWRSSQPTAIAQGKSIRGDEALRRLQEKTTVSISTSDDVSKLLPAIDINLLAKREKRTVNAILGTLCTSTDTKPQPLPNGDIKLIPLEKGEKLVWSNDLFGVLTTDADGKERMSLSMEPGRGIVLAYMDHRGGFAPGLPETYQEHPNAELPAPRKRPLTLGITNNGRPDWTQGSAQNSTYRTMVSMHPTHVHAVVGDMPDSTKLTPGESKTIGPQSIRIHLPEKLENGEWSIMINATVCGDVPWPPTPCSWDALTYSLAHANRYCAKGPNGKEIPTTVMNTSFNMRCMTVQITCPHEPVSMTVHAFRRMEPHMLELPDVTPPTPPPAGDPAPFVPQVNSPK